MRKLREELRALVERGEKRSAEESRRMRELTAQVQELRAEIAARNAAGAVDSADAGGAPAAEGRQGHGGAGSASQDAGGAPAAEGRQGHAGAGSAGHGGAGSAGQDAGGAAAAEGRQGHAGAGSAGQDGTGGAPERRDLNPGGRTGTASGTGLPTPGAGDYRMWSRSAEVREFIKLSLRSSTSKFFGNAAQAAGDRLRGAERELRDALGADRECLPWASIVDRNFLEQLAEGRALEEVAPDIDPEILSPEIRLAGDATSTIAANMQGRIQNAIVARVFTRGSTSYLGINIQPVPVGDVMWPVLDSGVSPEFKAIGASKAAEEATFSVKVLSPQDLTAAYLFNLKDLARVKGYETALRADLRMAMNSQLDKSILQGGASPNLDGGLIHALTAVDIGATSGAADWERWAQVYASAVDGIYAYDYDDLRVLMSPAAYQSAEALVQSNTAVTALEQIKRRTGGCRSSANMPPKTANKHTTLIAKMAMGATNAAAVVWNVGVNLIRENTSEADKRKVRLTAVGFYDCDVLRPAGFFEALTTDA